MPGFEDALNRAKQKKAAEEAQRLADVRKKMETEQTLEKDRLIRLTAEKKAEEDKVRNTAEWQKLEAFAKSTDFLNTLKAFYEKVSLCKRLTSRQYKKKRGFISSMLTGEEHEIFTREEIQLIPFSESLLVTKSPKSFKHRDAYETPYDVDSKWPEDKKIINNFGSVDFDLRNLRGYWTGRQFGKIEYNWNEHRFVDTPNDYTNISFKLFYNTDVDSYIKLLHDYNIEYINYGGIHGTGVGEKHSAEYEQSVMPKGIVIIFEGMYYSIDDFYDRLAEIAIGWEVRPKSD